jgi:hypothetical protein
LLPFGREKLFLKAVVITCILSLGAHILLSKNFAEKGSAVGTMLTEGCMTVLTAFFAVRTFGFYFPAKVAMQTAAALLPLVLLVVLFKYQFQNHLVIVLCSAVPGMLLYGTIQLFLFKNSLLKEVFTGLRRQQKILLTNG